MTKAKKSAAATMPPSGSQRSARVWALALAALVAAGGLGWWWLAARTPARLNLVLITIDTLRADHVGAYGGDAVETPTLDRLASRGVRFDHVQTSAPLTAPSHAT